MNVILRSAGLAGLLLVPPAAMSQSTLHLDTLDLRLAETGWGSTQSKRSIDGKPLTLGGQVFERGFGTHADGFLRLQLDGKATRFTAKVGIDDEITHADASVRFLVIGDGKTLWQSPVMTAKDGPLAVDVALSGVRQLSLVVSSAGNGNSYDHADWADALITYDGAAPIIPSSTFNLATADSSMVLKISGNKLRRTYFGPALGDPLPASGPGVIAYPTQWDQPLGENAIAVIQADGKVSLDLDYRTHRETKLDDNRSEWVFTLGDAVYPVEVDLHYLISRRENVIEQWSVVRNAGDKEITVEHAASGMLSAMAERYFLTTFTGAWGAESLLHEEELRNGVKEVRSLAGTRTTQPGHPSFVLALNQPAAEEDGEVILGTLAWSGNWRLRFDVDANHQLSAQVGYNPQLSRYRLAKGESLETPRLILTHSQHGKGPATRNLHRWARSYGLRGGNEPRRILLNSWEGAYFTFDDALIKRMISDAAKTGIELFVLDDGWFGDKHPRNDDKEGLGDWMVNPHKLKGGIQGLIDHAKQEGIDFGIWVEPEMVNPASELYEKHPDWVIAVPERERRPERNQLGLDLSNPAVQDYLFQFLDELLGKHPGISYLKWDCNRAVSDPGSYFLAASRQEHLWIDYVKGYYEVLRRITTKYPKVTFQACASGGGRNDYGAMAFHHEFWTSDNTDAVERIRMQWSANHFLPAIATAAHVTEVPNHQTGRVTPIKYRFDVAMTGRLGFELRPDRIPPAELEFSKRSLEEYKRIRPVVQFGDLHRLRSPFAGDLASLIYVHEKKALFFAFLLGKSLTDAHGAIPLHGLDPAKRYRLRELNLLDPAKPLTPYHNQVIGGDFLTGQGLRIPWGQGDCQSVVIEIEEE